MQGLETYVEPYIGPLLEILLKGLTHYFWELFDRQGEVGWIKSLLTATIIVVLVAVAIYLSNIISTALKNKFYALIVFILLVLTFVVLKKPAWKTLEYFNNTNIDNEDVETSLPKGNFISDSLKKSEVKDSLQSATHFEQEGINLVLQTPYPMHKEPDNSDEPDPPIFDGNCWKYSKEILTQTELTSPKKYQVKGQVDIFQRTIYLTGKPSGLVLVGTPEEYEAQALYIMGGRHRHTDAMSRLSAEDAMEKALVKMCENFQREGL